MQAVQNTKTDFVTVWQPIPNSSQELAIDSRCHHTLYEGARGPGKTITQLMKFRRYVGIGYGEYWRGVIFDREFDNLSGLVAESKKWFPKFFDGATWYSSASLYKWVWPTGEELLFRHVKKPEDYDGFHGHEYPFIGWNELTKFPTGELYDKFMSVNRSTFTPERDTPLNQDGSYATDNGLPLPPIPLIVFSTTNPNGPGHGWVKRRFITPAKRGQIVRTRVNVFNPQTQKDEVVEKTQVAIFGSYRENIYLPPEYVAELEKITDENLRKAWLYGDWDIVTGGALDDVWSKQHNILPRFPIPSYWRIDRAFDWGSSHPFAVGWFAEANGEEAEIYYEDKVFSFCPPSGSIIMFYEYYGTKEIGSNKGLKLGPTTIAKNILEIEEALTIAGWIEGKVRAGPADNQISNVSDSETLTIADRMEKAGVSWTKSDKSQGSRKIGLELVRELLNNAKHDPESPALYIMDCCKATIDILPTLPRDTKKIDDVDTDSEDHLYDMIRYRILSAAKVLLSKLKVKFPNG